MIKNKLFYINKYNENKNNLKILNEQNKNNETLLKSKIKILEYNLTALEILHLLRSKKISDKRKKIIDMLTSGCKDIFQQDYRIDILSNDEEGKSKIKDIKYNIILYKKNIEVARNEKLIMSTGGGVLSVFSFLLKIIINLIYTKEKFFIFDESMSQVSKNYQPRLSAFLKELCKKQDITLVLITHMELMSTYADYQYNLIGSFDEKGIPLLEIENEIKIKQYPYYELEMENFQSVKKLTFQFSGFTIIKGENDIGKSTITRALNSILYNDFQDVYIRWKLKRNEKCLISFKKYENKDKITFSMGIEKKSAEVIFNISGETFRGKQLSKDAILKELENKGFGSFIASEALNDLTKIKKRKISNLAITTQNDQLYLLDNSNSENNKIISYIFQASTINNGILRLKNIIKDLKTELKFIENEKIKIINNIQKKENLVSFYYKKSFLELLQLFNNCNIKLNSFNLKNKYIIKQYKTKLFYLYKYNLKILLLTKLNNKLINSNNKINNFIITKKILEKKLIILKKLMLLQKLKEKNFKLFITNNKLIITKTDNDLIILKKDNFNFIINKLYKLQQIIKLSKKYFDLNYKISQYHKKLMILNNNNIINKNNNIIKIQQVVSNIKIINLKLRNLIIDYSKYKKLSLNLLSTNNLLLTKKERKEKLIFTKNELLNKHICHNCNGKGYIF